MKSIKYCLNKQLSDICQRSIQLEELSEKVLQFIPKELAPHCQVASFNKGCLILSTTDGHWASLLRYALPELRDALRKEAQIYQLTSIKITINTELIQQKKNCVKKQKLSAETKELIINESQQCTYQPLRNALLHLADLE